MFRQLLLFCWILCFSSTAVAANKQTAERPQVAMSQNVTGTIDITADGKVVAYTLDQQEKLPHNLVEIAAHIVPDWRFEPVSLADNTLTRSHMTLMFVATPTDDGNFAVRLHDASFRSHQSTDLPTVTKRRRKFKYELLGTSDESMAGTIYVALRIGRDGKVTDIDVSHVDLHALGTDSAMQQWRDAFGKFVVSGVRDDVYALPSTGPDSGKDFWTGIMPMSVSVGLVGNRSAPPPIYGKWRTYIPGPKKAIPWLDAPSETINDAITADTLQGAQSHRRLLTVIDR